MKTVSKRSKAALAAVILLLTTAAAGFTEDVPEVSAALEYGILQLKAEGIPAEELEQTLEDGLRTMLRFEVQVRERYRWHRRTVQSADAGYTARLDPFNGTVELQNLSGDSQDYTRDEWYEHFVTARILIGEDLAANSEIRVRAVWDPVLLIPGLRFLQVIMPGMRRNGSWVQVRGDSGDNK